MKVLKFGGTSLAQPERISTVVEVVREAQQASPLAVVVSALGGVTDALTETAAKSAGGGNDSTTVCDELSRRHRLVVDTLLDEGERDRIWARIASGLEELRDLFHGVSLVRECTPRTLDLILSYGERLSATLVAAALRRGGVEAEDCDARQLILTEESFGGAQVTLEPTYERIRRHFSQHPQLQVVTGFISASPSGDTTTLGRGGSDLTAALLGAALKAEVIEIWTDVDGVMSADPRLVPDAFSLDCLSYEELMELSHFGAKVVYPPTIRPARSSSIPLVIKNTLNPGFAGTRVEERVPLGKHSIRGISSINRVALLRLEGDGMLGVPGTAQRLFHALAARDISVILISQASSEHSICFAVAPEAVARAKEGVEQEFQLERQMGLIDDLIIEEELSVIAAVGEGMREQRGVAGRLFSVLGDRGVSVQAIAQGSSELNISLVLSRQREVEALRAIHDAFFRREDSVGHVFVVGTGRVGGALLEQLRQSMEGDPGQDLPLRLSGVGNRRFMALDRQGLKGDWQEELETSGTTPDLEALAEYVRRTPGWRVLVDCTASDAVPECYLSLLQAGVAVITANKRPFSGPLAERRKLLGWPACPGLYYETTVGAGLPVIGTLRRLLTTGDRVVRIEGIFSGSIGFLCTQLRQGVPFSEAVRRAHREGYTEPDPRDDLRGTDVARKLLILAREAGFEIEPEEVEVESLIPNEDLDSLPLEEFWSALPSVDEHYRERQARCDPGCSLSYLARLEDGRARVGLEIIDSQHPCATASGPDNLFAFHTHRYRELPLVVRGPGAGPAVTAAGVFADILQARLERDSAPRARRIQP